MPRDKDLKRLVRRRMDKTGESYTTARAHILSASVPASPVSQSPRSAGSAPGPSVRPMPKDHESLAGMSDSAVARATGKTWPEWTALLDRAGAASLSHAEIARLAVAEEGTSQWWAQTVTVAYERFRGLRDVGQRRDGGYDVNKSKTIGVSVAVLFEAFQNAAIRARWLPGVELTIRKATPDKSIRIRMSDGSPLDVYFSSKARTRSSVTLQHRTLPNREAADRMKVFWGERLAALAEEVRGR